MRPSHVVRPRPASAPRAGTRALLLAAVIAGVLALPGALPAAFADDAPTPPKQGERRPPDPPKDPAAPAEKPPAPDVDQLVADMGDAKFAVKRLDAAAAAKSVQDPKLLAPLVKLLRDENTEIRTTAIAALGARREPEQQKKAAEALAARLKSLAGKPEAESERTEIARALHDLAQVGAIEALLDDVGQGMGLDEVDARCRAVGNVPSPKAIEALIAFMQKGHRDGSGWRASAARALEYATGERRVNDPDQWRAWWKDHEKTFDFEAAAAARRKAEEEKAAKDASRKEKKERREKGKKGGKGEGEGGSKGDDGGSRD
jgi:HEAT repeat protein